MDHLTFRGGAGTAIRGGFTTRADGIGDTSISGLVRLFSRGLHRAHLNLGLSLPTGSNTERDDILTPLGTTPTVRLPYAMQLGSGTVDLLPGLTYVGRQQKLSWGAQYSGTVRTGSDNGYQLGDKHQLTGWLAYQPISALSGSVRLRYDHEGSISGIDPRIAGPVQTANPDNYGGETLNLLLGMNWVGQSGWLKGKRLALEGALPVHRDLNGPQMEMDFVITGGLQIAF